MKPDPRPYPKWWLDAAAHRRAEHSATWVRQAEHDLEGAELSGRDGRWNLVCFLAQQAASKALKGALILERGDHPHVHRIERLLNDLAAYAAIESDVARRALGLDKYYLTTRYPDVLDYALPATSFTAEEGMFALTAATDVCASVRRHLATAGVFDDS